MVSEKDLMEAYQKGKKSGAASAYAKARKGKGKRRKKVYRMKKFGSSTKQAIGRFQSKHPYVAGAIEGTAIGSAAAGVLQAAGFEVFSSLRFMRRIPLLGRIYVPIANASVTAVRRLKS